MILSLQFAEIHSFFFLHFEDTVFHSTKKSLPFVIMAVHIFGKQVKHNSVVRDGLKRAIFGIGHHTADRLCAKVGIYPKMRMNQLSEPQIMDLNKEISEMLVEGRLKQKINNDIQAMRNIGSYAGLRHASSLPVRGQGTRSNAQTAKKLNKIPRFKL